MYALQIGISVLENHLCFMYISFKSCNYALIKKKISVTDFNVQLKYLICVGYLPNARTSSIADGERLGLPATGFDLRVCLPFP